MKNGNLVLASYNGVSVSFTDDAWFNATEIAEKYGKRVADWMETKDTQDYIAALTAILKVPKTALLESKRGRYGGTWMHPRMGVPFARWLDVSFGVWCDDQIYKILTGKHPHYDWKKMRSEAASSYKVMSAVLQLQRQNLGKPTAHHHYQNEAKLVNWALIGKFEGIDRESLSDGDLELLAKLEERNTVLIGVGLDRDERKKALEKFVTDWRVAHVQKLAAA